MGYKSLVNKSIAQASKENYQTTIELIDVYVSNDLLREEERSNLLLEQAILFQQNGDAIQACKTLNLYESLSIKNFNTKYYLCKGKLLSQVNKSPHKLSLYLEFIEQKDIFQKPENKKLLSSLYWRASVLWQMEDIPQSNIFLAKHRDLTEIGNYQDAHNYSVNGLLNIANTAKQKSNFSKMSYIDKSLDMLVQSVDKYAEIENFKWLNKCIVSNLLMLALVDYFLKSPIKFYRKIFYARKLFIMFKIGYKDEAIAEIIAVIKGEVPEVYEILFCKNILSFMQKHPLSSVIKEIYLDVEYEFIEITSQSKLNVVDLFRFLLP